MLTYWSEQRNGDGPNSICVQYRLVPDMRMLKSAYNWIHTEPAVTHKKEALQNVAYITRDGKSISDDDIISWSSSTRHQDWNTFSDYIDCEIQTHRVYYNDSSYAPDFVCTCSFF